MIVLKYKQDVKEYIKAKRAENKQIGFVATMGALHPGHLSLIDIAASQNQIVICSIFINPLQFNDVKDFEKYPQTIEADLKVLEAKKCDMAFVPDVNEMYSNEDNTVFDFANLDKVMEGVFRPGHFLGMAKVVKRFFDIITPDKAYFGKKDFQQLAIIKKFTEDLNLPVKIVGCPIEREKDGLAMSSRNILLSEQERILAPKIFKTISEAKSMVPELTVPELKKWVEVKINSVSGFQLEYFEITDSINLTLLANWANASSVMGFIVVRIGDVRLIDNIELIP